LRWLQKGLFSLFLQLSKSSFLPFPIFAFISYNLHHSHHSLPSFPFICSHFILGSQPIICGGYISARSFDSYDYLSLYFHIFLHFYSFHLYKVLTFLTSFISIHLYSFHNRITTHYLWWLQKRSFCRFLRLSESSKRNLEYNLESERMQKICSLCHYKEVWETAKSVSQIIIEVEEPSNYGKLRS
jgi:hypothetical protein